LIYIPMMNEIRKTGHYRIKKVKNYFLWLPTENIGRRSTHPDITMLVTPLCPLGKERSLILFLNPLCGEAGERVVQRSVDRAS